MLYAHQRSSTVSPPIERNEVQGIARFREGIDDELS